MHRGASESGGKGWRAIAEHYIIGIPVNVPFFVLRICEADGEMIVVGDIQAPTHSDISRPCNLRNGVQNG